MTNLYVKNTKQNQTVNYVGKIGFIKTICSHDAGTGRKRHEKVTFSLSVHTMPVRNCALPSLLLSQNNAGC